MSFVIHQGVCKLKTYSKQSNFNQQIKLISNKDLQADIDQNFKQYKKMIPEGNTHPNDRE